MNKSIISLLLAAFSLNLFCRQDIEIVLDSTYSYIWDTITSDWVFSQYYLYAYDARENRTEEIWYQESEDGEKSHVRNAHVYDINGNLTKEAKYQWDLKANDWQFSTKDLSYCSELTTSVSNSMNDLNYIFYPNPTNDRITIVTNIPRQQAVEITSLISQLMYSKKMEETTNQIDLSSLDKGAYLITIRSKDFVATRKLIKLKVLKR